MSLLVSINKIIDILDFFNLIFWQNFVSSTIATICGVLLGIPIALYIERIRISANKYEKEESLLLLYKETIIKNKNLLNQALQELSLPINVIYYNVDTTLLESTASIKYEVITDIVLNKELDYIRYELNHLHKKIDLYLEINFSSFRAIGSFPRYNQDLHAAILVHITNLLPRIDQLLTIINSNL